MLIQLTRLSLAALFACLLAAPAGGCSAHEETVAASDFETRLILKRASGAESHEFPDGEPITMVVTIRNRASGPRTLTFPSSQTHDCIVYSGDHKEIWRFSSDRMFAQVITEMTLQPGESRAFTATWDQRDSKGRPVSPAGYEAVGLVSAGAPGCRSDPVRFTIRPPAAGKPKGP